MSFSNRWYTMPFVTKVTKYRVCVYWKKVHKMLPCLSHTNGILYFLPCSKNWNIHQRCEWSKVGILLLEDVPQAFLLIISVCYARNASFAVNLTRCKMFIFTCTFFMIALKIKAVRERHLFKFIFQLHRVCWYITVYIVASKYTAFLCESSQASDEANFLGFLLMFEIFIARTSNISWCCIRKKANCAIQITLSPVLWLVDWFWRVLMYILRTDALGVIHRFFLSWIIFIGMFCAGRPIPDTPKMPWLLLKSKTYACCFYTSRFDINLNKTF